MPLGEDPGDEAQQLIEGVEMGRLIGHHMFHPAHDLSLPDIGRCGEVHDKRPVDREG